MRSKIIIFSILETLFGPGVYADMDFDMDFFQLLDSLVTITTTVMPAWETTTEYYPEDPTTERVITVLDQMENIENHRSRFITLCDD